MPDVSSTMALHAADRSPLRAEQRQISAPIVPPQIATLPMLLLLASDVFRNVTLVSGVDPFNAQLISYIIWIIGAVWLLAKVRRNFHVPTVPAFVWSVLIVLSLLLTTLLVGISGGRSDQGKVWQQTFMLVAMMIPYFSLTYASTYADANRSIIVLCNVLTALGLLSIGLDFFEFTSFLSNFGRYFGFMGDPVAWVLTLPFVLYFSTGRLVMAGLVGIGLALTASRGPALCSLAALLLLFALNRGKRFQQILTFVLLAIIALFQSPLFANLASRIGSTTFMENDRLVTARLGLRIFERSPIFGEGYNSLVRFYPYHANIAGKLPTQTSTFVQMLSDGGLLLFVPFVGFVVALTVGSIKLLRIPPSVGRSPTINGAAAWLVSMLWVNQSAAWFVAGSYVGPLVLGMAGIISGYWARLRLVQSADQRPLVPSPRR